MHGVYTYAGKAEQVCLALGKRGTEVCGLSEVLIPQWRTTSRESSGFELCWAYPSTERGVNVSGPRAWSLCRAEESLCAPHTRTTGWVKDAPNAAWDLMGSLCRGLTWCFRQDSEVKLGLLHSDIFAGVSVSSWCLSSLIRDLIQPDSSSQKVSPLHGGAWRHNQKPKLFLSLDLAKPLWVLLVMYVCNAEFNIMEKPAVLFSKGV